MNTHWSNISPTSPKNYRPGMFPTPKRIWGRNFRRSNKSGVIPFRTAARFLSFINGAWRPQGR